jgi:hypothetical protein
MNNKQQISRDKNLMSIYAEDLQINMVNRLAEDCKDASELRYTSCHEIAEIIKKGKNWYSKEGGKQAIKELGIECSMKYFIETNYNIAESWANEMIQGFNLDIKIKKAFERECKKGLLTYGTRELITFSKKLASVGGDVEKATEETNAKKQSSVKPVSYRNDTSIKIDFTIDKDNIYYSKAGTTIAEAKDDLLKIIARLERIEGKTSKSKLVAANESQVIAGIIKKATSKATA